MHDKLRDLFVLHSHRRRPYGTTGNFIVGAFAQCASRIEAKADTLNLSFIRAEIARGKHKAPGIPGIA